MPHKPNKMSNKMPTKKRSRRDLSSLYRAWRRRPLSGLRWQLTFTSSLLLAIVMIVYTIWISESIEPAGSSLPPGIQVAAVALIIVGAVLLFIMINFLLH